MNYPTTTDMESVRNYMDQALKNLGMTDVVVSVFSRNDGKVRIMTTSVLDLYGKAK